MAKTQVLRFTRSDDDTAFVLVRITSKGSKPLDVKLVGTEGEAPYVASLKQDRVSSLKVKNCPSSDSEWLSILQSMLNQEPLPHIQATATVQSESSIAITIRKEIQGITQRLGSITLNHDPDEGIELFDWCGVAAEAAVAAKENVAELTAKTNNMEAAVEDLKSQLEELIQAKDEDETALLRKFQDLLNEKKVKIREQQRVLASGSFNASVPGSSQQQQSQVPSPQPARKAGKSRSAKRKAPASNRIEDESEDDGAQEMDVDIKTEPQDTDPGNTTEATASTDSDNDAEEDEADGAPIGSAQDSDSPEAAPERQSTEHKKPPQKTTEQPPPRRDLPFGNKKPKKSSTPPADSATDSDDEL